jgi:hypothetical protein
MAEFDSQREETQGVVPKRKPKDELTVPKFWPNAVMELLPVKTKGVDTTADTVCASKVNDDDKSE